ncbi:uncharacterized protein [Branchiostoma lanceolatum]|uniref:uncharacterized protein n=1 Tax=Branchiostoma lanceolatum TaxID=7740 RepID=UPI003452707E
MAPRAKKSKSKGRVKKHVCQYCDYKTKNSVHFKYHVRKHTGERPYQCQQCEYSASREKTLDMHIMIKHTGDRPHRCEHCDYSAANKTVFANHVMATHTGWIDLPNMADPGHNRRHPMFAVIQHQHDIVNLQLHLLRERKRRRRRARQRTVWVRPWIERRQQFGIYHQLMVELRNEDTRAFQNFMRMPPAMYGELLARVGRRLSKEDTFMRHPLEPGLMLALTLHHIISGNTYAPMKFARRVPHNTISVIVPQVCEATIVEYLDQVMVCPSTPNQWHQIADRFLQKWNFPHTCGAIDGKHVACRCPENSGSVYFNYKGSSSMLHLFGSLDSLSASVFNGSELKECIEDGTIGFQDPEPLPNDTQDVPFFITGDAFSLRTTLMKPRVVENAFGILSNRFQVMLTTMKHEPSTVKLIVTTCVVLHNLMRIRYPALQDEELDQAENADGEFVAETWRDGRNLQDTIDVAGPNRATRDGKMQRNLIKHWLNSEAGSVPWQDDMI